MGTEAEPNKSLQSFFCYTRGDSSTCVLMLLSDGRSSQVRQSRNEEDQKESYEGRFAFSFLAYEAAHESSSLHYSNNNFITLFECREEKIYLSNINK